MMGAYQPRCHSPTLTGTRVALAAPVASPSSARVFFTFTPFCHYHSLSLILLPSLLFITFLLFKLLSLLILDTVEAEARK